MKRISVTCLLVLLSACLVISSCHTIHPRHKTSTDQSLATIQEGINIDRRNAARHRGFGQIPAPVSSALLPPLSHYVQPSRTISTFDVNANNVPAREFFMGLVSGTKYNMLVHPQVTGNISITLKNVTIEQALNAVHRLYGYQFHSTSYGYEVTPAQLETQLFHLNYLDVQRNGKSYMQLTTGQVSNKIGTVGTGQAGVVTPVTVQGPPEGLGTISSVETKSEMHFWRTIEATIQNMLDKSEGHSVSVNSQTGVILVRAFPGELHRIARFLRNLQNSLNRQVILEAKILEVQLDDTFQSGIDWGILNNPALVNAEGLAVNDKAGMGQSANQAFAGTELKALDGIFAIRVNGNFNLLINLLQTQGNVQVLSSPHISTVNNQKAVIKVGQDEFFVTGVSTTNTIIGTNTLPSQDVSLTPFFSGITLDVTPEISKDNTVILHIHPSVSKVTEQQKTITVGSNPNGTPNELILPLAFSTIRESDNIVRAKNGQVVVIGGLMQNNQREIIAATPWVSKIPFLGWAFRRTAQTSAKSELVILLRPIVASNNVIISKLEEEKRRFQIFRRPFHAGGLPKIFGNEGERADNE